MAKSYKTGKKSSFSQKKKEMREMEELEESGLMDLLSNRQKLYSNKTLETAIALCQFLLDTDQTGTHEGRQYKTLCTYLMLEGCLYDVGAWDTYMELES